jgi:hypothetical protein
MAGASGESRPGGNRAEPSAIRKAAGLPAAPGYVSAPTSSTSGHNPELRRLVLLGVGLIFCVVVTLVLAPSRDAGVATTAPPKAEETAEERRQRVQTMFDGALTKVSDGADFDQSRAYLDVIKGLSRQSPDDVRTRATEWLDYARAVNQPATLRGSYVRVRGLVARVDTEKLVTPVGEVTDVWRCYIGQPDGSEPKVVDLLKKPGPDLDVGRDVIDVEALFFRLVGFDSAKESKTGQPLTHSEVPFLLAQSCTIYEPPPRGLQGTARVVLLAGLVVLGIVVAVVVARQRVVPQRRHPALLDKPGVGIREMFEMRRREGSVRPPPPAPKSP